MQAGFIQSAYCCSFCQVFLLMALNTDSTGMKVLDIQGEVNLKRFKRLSKYIILGSFMFDNTELAGF